MHTAYCRRLQQIIDKKKPGLEKANGHIASLQKHLLPLERVIVDDASIKFYTGFPNWSTFMAIFNYLDLGIKGENIKYWVFQSNSDLSTDLYEGQTELLAEKRKI